MPQFWNFSLSIATLSVLAFLTCSRPIHRLPNQWQQKPLKISAWKNGSYEAPTGPECDDPDANIIKDEYIVFLHWGYSLEQHKSVVGSAVDFDSAIGRIFNESKYSGLRYTALLKEEALAAVRADIGVDMVLCEGRPEPDMVED